MPDPSNTPAYLETLEHFKAAFFETKEYAVSLERDRANLWGINEVLRNRVLSLEGRGPLNELEDLPLFRNTKQCDACQSWTTVEHDEQWDCRYCKSRPPFETI